MRKQLTDGDVRVRKGREVSGVGFINIDLSLFPKLRDRQGGESFGDGCKLKLRIRGIGGFILEAGITEGSLVDHFSFFSNQYVAIERAVCMVIGIEFLFD